jgi:hypothetical protein
LNYEKTKKKEYHIDSFEKLCNVANFQNVKVLAVDLANWLIFYQKAIDEIRKKHPKETAGKLNSEILGGSFTWVDDGKNDFLGMSVENKSTGETIKIKL